jgi:hypothetical protein
LTCASFANAPAPDTGVNDAPALRQADYSSWRHVRERGASQRAEDRRARPHGAEAPARLDPALQHRERLGVHPHDAVLVALAVAHVDRPASRVDVARHQPQRLLQAQAAAVEHDDQRPVAHPRRRPVRATGDQRPDLLDGQDLRRVAPALVAGRAAGVIARRDRATGSPAGHHRTTQRSLIAHPCAENSAALVKMPPHLPHQIVTAAPLVSSRRARQGPRMRVGSCFCVIAEPYARPRTPRNTSRTKTRWTTSTI